MANEANLDACEHQDLNRLKRSIENSGLVNSGPVHFTLQFGPRIFLPNYPQVIPHRNLIFWGRF
jgi:hypothetical protein